jgi:uncharacterized cupin superfamily protein
LTTLSFRAAELTDLVAQPLGPPSAEPITGDIMTRSFVPFTSDDGKILCGTWECAVGASRWEFLDRGEFIHVLNGRMIVQADGGDPVELTAGTSAVFPLGWCGTWTVTETLRKVFTVFRP